LKKKCKTSTAQAHGTFGHLVLLDYTIGQVLRDLERTLTLFSGSHHSLTLKISQTAKDTAIVTSEGDMETAHKLLNVTSFNDLE